jgi:hypothetical protein
MNNRRTGKPMHMQAERNTVLASRSEHTFIKTRDCSAEIYYTVVRQPPKIFGELFKVLVLLVMSRLIGAADGCS